MNGIKVANRSSQVANQTPKKKKNVVARALTCSTEAWPRRSEMGRLAGTERLGGGLIESRSLLEKGNVITVV